MPEYRYSSPLGTISIKERNGKIVSLSFGGFPADGGDHTEAIAKAVSWLDCYFSHGPLPESPELDLSGTSPFQRRVYAALSRIPYGETRSYGDVAKEIGPRMSNRAVGRALSKNPVLLLIPCHRVVCSDGKIGGYSGGVDRKKRLLELEEPNHENAFSPK